MGTFIVVFILLICMIGAVLSSRKHFKGEGGCCGGGSIPRKSRILSENKKLNGPKLGAWQLQVEGMHCENCKSRVEQAVNQFDGVVCWVNLRKKIARVEYSTDIPVEELQAAIEKAGYQVTAVQAA